MKSVIVLAVVLFFSGCAQTPHIAAKFGNIEYYSSKNVSIDATLPDGKRIKIESDGAAVMRAQAELMAAQTAQLEAFRSEIRSLVEALAEKVSP